MQSKKAITITAKHELIIVCSVIGLLIISLIAPWNVARVILGVPFVLFFPGYTFLSALFPKKGKLDHLERFIISAGFSLVIVSLLSFVLNYTPWGLRVAPLFIVYSVFILASSLASYFQRSRMPEEERFGIEIPSMGPGWKKTAYRQKILSIILVSSILIAVGSIGFAIIKQKPGEKFTELYVLGKDDKASGYPEIITLGESATVKVGIINREQRIIPYRLAVVIGGAPTFTNGSIVLGNEQKWEDAIPLTPTKPGKQQKVEINIYRPEDTSPYQYLILWVDVVGKGS